jgi:hypothetical protein
MVGGGAISSSSLALLLNRVGMMACNRLPFFRSVLSESWRSSSDMA